MMNDLKWATLTCNHDGQITNKLLENKVVEEISGSAFFDFAKKNLFDCTGKIYFKFGIFRQVVV